MTALYCWKSINPKQNRYRYYSLLVQRDLWGQLCVVKRWGRLSGGAREKFTWVGSDDELEALITKVRRQRELHGYVAA